MSAPELRNIVIVYEDRDEWVEHALPHLPRKTREELSYWLLDKETVFETERMLSRVARRNGARVELLTIDDFVRNFADFTTGKRRNRTLVWNITDGHASFKGSHIPSLAILAGMPYYGCPPYAQALGQDKFKLFLLCRAIGVPTPQSALADGGTIVSSFLEQTSGPYFVKPNSFGNKVGLSYNSLQSDLAGAVRQAAVINRRYGNQAIIQEFIAGPEVRFSFINANAAHDLRTPTFGYDVVDTIRWSNTAPVFISATQRDSAYDKHSMEDLWLWNGMPEAARVHAIEQMTAAVTLLARYVRLKDYFTIDFRIDAHDVPRLIDFNPGAFLDDDAVAGYTERKLHMPLPDAVFSAMRNSFAGRHPAVFARAEHMFNI